MSKNPNKTPQGDEPARWSPLTLSGSLSKEMTKTLVFVVAALLMTGAAILGRVDRSTSPLDYNDQGKKFFDDFDPTTCTTLEVIDVDPTTAVVLPFKVTLKGGKWVIPSHFDYPADAKQRLIDTATGVFGLIKDSVRSDRTEDHEVFGVIDPLDAKATSLRGIGKRVTLKDTSDKILADFIIGNEVKGHPEQRYVRTPGQKRTYGVNVKVDLSTRFADWIETNLLKLDAARVRKVVIDHKGVDFDNRKVVNGDVITLERKDASSPWTINSSAWADAGMPAGKEPNSDTLLSLTNALGDLKIAGIRPKPEGLTADLMRTPGDARPRTRESAMSLIKKGFYLTEQGELIPSKGEVSIMTDEGVVYTLRYGEVLIATGSELSAGTEPSKAAKALEKATNKGTEGTSEGRFLFVTAAFDPSLIPLPKSAVNDDDKLPDDPFAYDEGDKKLVGESKEAKEKAEKLKKDRDAQIAEGQKRVKELTDRFAAWYYVTPGDSYRTIVQDQANLIREKSAKPANPMPGPGGRPGGFNPGSFSPSFGPPHGE
jgi:Domain of unknown function (DUF4340)